MRFRVWGLNSLKAVMLGSIYIYIYIYRSTIGVMKGDTGSFHYSSCG